jgi:NAD(P)H-dependent flavin oxidoreductase YrpB (nitropropane dioxygenase family)
MLWHLYAATGLGSPAFMVPEAHARGMKVIGVVGSVRQARREVEAGVDIIVAQGHEAGGHKCGGFDEPRFRKPRAVGSNPTAG